MTILENKFPKTIFCKQYIEKYGINKAISKQLEVVSGELFEIRDAFSKNEYEHSIEECIDAMQAIHTILYMIPGYSSEKVEKKLNEVKIKNEKRGYY
ncbi:MAG: hypothetical protein AAB875_01040 [Patescibacteria group bacterium]